MPPNSADEMPINDWSYDQFLCLVLLYASYADYEYTNDEREHILTFVDDSILEEVEQVFNKLGDYEQLDLILSLKQKYITSEQDRAKLLKILKGQFNSDGDFSKLENVLFKFLERLM